MNWLFSGSDFFDVFNMPLDAWVTTGVRWLVSNYRPFFQQLKQPVEVILQLTEAGLLAIPPLIFLVGLFLLAWRATNWKVALFSFLSFFLIGAIGMWDLTMTTLAMVLTAVIICVILGVPLGILAARSDRFAGFLRPVLDIMQTTPSFVYLVPVVMLFSIGTVSGVIATVVFALPPIIRLTNLGIRQVPSDVVEAATAFGSTERDILFKVRLPLALPTIMAGLNQTLMLSLSMVVIAALIGAGGLGRPVVEGLNALRVGVAFIGGLGIVLMAMVLDRITQAFGKSQQ